METRFQVGIIANTHGIHGEVKVFPTTDDVGRFKKLKEVILDTGKEELLLTVKGVRFFKKFAILKFEGYDNINDIEKYKGRSLYVERKDAVRLRKDEYFIADLIGCTVVDEEEQELGVLKDVLETGANDVYLVKSPDGKELLFPAIRDCVQKVDVENRLIRVHVMPGLLD